MNATREQQLALLAMLHQPISQTQLARLLHQGLSPQAIISNSALLSAKQGRAELKVLNHAGHQAWQHARQTQQQMAEAGQQLLLLDDPCWPEALNRIDSPPGWLFAQGSVRLLQKPQLALVGSRHASPAALRRAYELAERLAHAGWVITSGLALGIDAQAHLGALVQGRTVAVIGSGLSNLYPKRHQRLAAKVCEQGVLVSEYLPTEPPLSWHFPARNRLLSGLAQGVVVVEAGVRSGSLITARLALEQGKEVMAMPGSPDNPNARGCHQLIKQGAALVNDAEDVLELMGSQVASPCVTLDSTPRLEGLAKLIWQELDEVPMSLDSLCLRLDRPLAQLLPLLLQLQLQGRIVQQGHWLSRA